MRAGQQMVDEHGNQVALFPLEYLYVSQGENGSYSHQGILAIDFLGWELMVEFYNVPTMLLVIVKLYIMILGIMFGKV